VDDRTTEDSMLNTRGYSCFRFVSHLYSDLGPMTSQINVGCVSVFVGLCVQTFTGHIRQSGKSRVYASKRPGFQFTVESQSIGAQNATVISQSVGAVHLVSHNIVVNFVKTINGEY